MVVVKMGKKPLRAIGDPFGDLAGNNNDNSNSSAAPPRQPAQHNGGSDEENRGGRNRDRDNGNDVKDRRKKKRRKSDKKRRSQEHGGGKIASTPTEIALAQAMARGREARLTRRQKIIRETERLAALEADGSSGRKGKREVERRGGKVKGVTSGKKRMVRPTEPTSRMLRSAPKRSKRSAPNGRKRKTNSGEHSGGDGITVAGRGANEGDVESDENYDPTVDLGSDDTSCGENESSSERELPNRRNRSKDYEEEAIAGICDEKRKNLVSMQQGNIDHIIPFAPFVRLIREICEPMGTEFRWSKLALRALQCAAEHELDDIFRKMQMAADHAKRKGITKADLYLTINMTGREMKSDFTEAAHLDSIELFNRCKDTELED